MSTNLRPNSLIVCAFCCSALMMAQTVRSGPHILIRKPVDVTRLFTLAGNTRPEASRENDRGRVADSFAIEHMLLQLKRSPEQEQALESFIDQQYDSSSPNFHKWLSAAQYGELYGPATQDIDTVSEWLRSNGLTVNTVYPSGMAIDFSGTAGQVLAAFGTEIHRLSVNGRDHLANMSDPHIPAALAPVVVGIVSLHDFWPYSMRVPATPKFSLQSQLVAPADLATIYDLNAAFTAGYTGQGQTIAVIESSDLYDTADWGRFRTVFGLTSYTGGTISASNPAPPSGSSNCSDPGANSADIEATLDAEWASASAPNATIVVAACDNSTTTPGFVIATLNTVNGSHPPQVMSVSYGFCEAATGVAANAMYNSAYQQAAAEGVSVFVASGDAGAAACDHDINTATHGIGVSSSSSTPYNVAVGGTDFGDTYQGKNALYWGPKNSATYGSALSYVPEIPWNDSCAGSLLAGYLNYTTGYGSTGFCSSARGQEFYVTTAAGSGGPSGCASGVPSQNLVVGGTCKGYAKPSWQTGVPGIPNDGVRDVPDVSLFAANGLWGHSYPVCFSDPKNLGVTCTLPPGDWPRAGGTSFSSPIMAGIQALVNQKMGGAQGNPNPVYYKLAASSVASSVFHAITTGDIAVNCSGDINCFGSSFEGRGRVTSGFDSNGGLSTSNQTYTPAFAAGAGWNFATGLGSVDAFNLIQNWSKGQ